MELNIEELSAAMNADAPVTPQDSFTDAAFDPTPVDTGATLDFDFSNLGGLDFEADNAFVDAIQRGIDNTQGSFYATANAMGSVFGVDMIAEFGEEGFRQNMLEASRNPARLDSFDDVDGLAAFGTYVAEGIGENLFNMATMATGAGIGAQTAKAMIAKSAIMRMNKELAEKAVKRRALAGAAIPGYGMGAGEVQGEFLVEGIDAPGTALIAGVPIMGMDVTGFGLLLKNVFKDVPVETAKSLLTQTAKGFGLGFATEMPTEMAQELMVLTARAYEDPTFEIFTEENFKRLREAGLKGGFTGGAFGGGGRAVRGTRDLLRGNAFPDDAPTPGPALGPGSPGFRGGPAGPPGPVGPTAPEPIETLQAGVDAIGRGGRIAAYSSDPTGFDNVDRPAGSTLVRSIDGGVYLVPHGRAHDVQTMDRDNRQHEILGYPAPKPENPEGATVVQARDAQGRTVQDVVATAENLDAVIAQGKEAAGEGGTVEVMDPREAIAARSANKAASEQDAADGRNPWIDGPAPAAATHDFDDDGVLEGFSQGRDERDQNATFGDGEGGQIDASAELNEPVTITVKHNTTATILRALRPGATQETNTDKSRNVTFPPADPNAVSGNPADNNPRVLKALSKIFDDGKTEDRGRITVTNPTSKRRGNTRISIPAVMQLGRTLNQLNDVTSNPRTDFLEGMAYLLDLGFQPLSARTKQNGTYTGVALNVRNAPADRTNMAGLPLNTVVAGREETGNVQTLASLLDTGSDMNKLSARVSAVEKLLHETTAGAETREATSAEIKNEINKLKSFLKNRFKPGKDGQLSFNFGPAEREMVQDQISDLYKQLKDMGPEIGAAWGAVKDLRTQLEALSTRLEGEVDTKDSSFDGRDIENTQEVDVKQEVDDTDNQATVAGKLLTEMERIIPLARKAIKAENLKRARAEVMKLRKLIGEAVLSDGLPRARKVGKDQKVVDDRSETLVAVYKATASARTVDLKELAQMLNELDQAVAEAAGRISAKTVNKQSTDTRGFETDADQARASARDRMPHRAETAKKPRQLLAHKNNMVRQISTSLNEKLVDLAGSVLKLLGMRTRVTIVDEDGAVAVIKKLKNQLKTAEKEQAEVLSTKIAELERVLRDSPKGRIIYFDQFTRAEDRSPVIFISMNNKGAAKQSVVLAHEIGHLIQRVALDQAPKKVQSALREALGTENFEENFANQLWRWMVDLDTKAADELKHLNAKNRVITRNVLRPDNVKKGEAERASQLKRMQLIGEFFQNLAKMLHKAWQHMRKEYKLNEEFADFINAMMAVNMKQNNIPAPETRLGKKYQTIIEDMAFGPFMPYRPDASPAHDNYSADTLRALANNAAMQRRIRALMDKAKEAKKVLTFFNEKVMYSADAWMRALNSPLMTDIADHFHHQPGLQKKRRTTFEEVRREMGLKQEDIDAILTMLPTIKQPGYWNRRQVDTSSPEYNQLMDMLLGGASIADFNALPDGAVKDAGLAVRAYMDKMLAWSQAHGTRVKERKNYFPIVMDKGLWMNNHAEIMQVFARFGYTPEYAQRVWEAVTQGDGYLADILQDDDKLLGPSFKFMKKRKLSPDILRELRPYMVDDLGGILQFYTHSAVERGVIEKRFGLSSQERSRMQDEFIELGIGDHLNSPVAKLHWMLSKALRDGEITHEQYQYTKNKVLEAYFGRLGANIDPRWQKIQSAAVLYQNMRLLSMAVLTAIVDPGQLVWRAGDFSVFSRGMKKIFDSNERADLYKMGRLMGTIQDEITEHVLNDQTSTQFLSPKMKRLNEKFFRVIGMHQWTNITRVMGLAVGREFLTEHATGARAGDAKSIEYLKELGVTPDQVDRWKADGFTVTNQDHEEAISALNTFVDEAIIRPDATTRPTWASDRNWQIFFHLKSFMWGYHETIIKRIINTVKKEPSKMQMLQNGGLQMAMLVAATLPLALAGYETRRWLSWWGNPPAHLDKEGGELVYELAQRAGYLGLFQFIADAEQAENFGKMSILAVGGPTVGHIEEFLRQDFGNALMRSVPFLSQSSAGRAFLRDTF